MYILSGYFHLYLIEISSSSDEFHLKYENKDI